MERRFLTMKPKNYDLTNYVQTECLGITLFVHQKNGYPCSLCQDFSNFWVVSDRLWHSLPTFLWHEVLCFDCFIAVRTMEKLRRRFAKSAERFKKEIEELEQDPKTIAMVQATRKGDIRAACDLRCHIEEKVKVGFHSRNMDVIIACLGARTGVAAKCR